MKNILSYTTFIFFLVSCSNKYSENDKNTNSEFQKSKEAVLKDTTFGVTSDMVKIDGGKYVPLYGRDSQLVIVDSFFMDILPVTNGDFRAFVRQNKRWRKSKVKKIFADGNYLNSWLNDTTLGAKMNDSSPITNVSWYAAKAYCECQGKQLATVDEWEFVARANQEFADARKVKSYNQFILDWYEKPKTHTEKVGQTDKNYWGVYDLHGLVWEWTSDFSSILLTGESRNDIETDKNLFCGNGSLNATDLMNYAAFMRYAYRNSLKANYCTKNLGFRCIKYDYNSTLTD